MEKKILVVDDEKLIREVIQNVFEEKGYTVRTAESAEQALEVLKDESILVIILDLTLPGIGGVEFCKKMRMENHVGFIFAITGFVDLYDIISCRNAGFDDFFTKPFSLDAIAHVVEDAFEKLKRWKVDEYGLA